MTFRVSYSEKPAYLHATVTGVNSRENVSRYLSEVLQECITRGATRVLIEERLEGPRLEAMDVFQVAAEGSERALGFFEAVAYVDVNAVGGLMKFAETVAVNRFMPVSVFDTVAQAEQWLLEKAEQPRGSTPAGNR